MQHREGDDQKTIQRKNIHCAELSVVESSFKA